MKEWGDNKCAVFGNDRKDCIEYKKGLNDKILMLSKEKNIMIFWLKVQSI